MSSAITPVPDATQLRHVDLILRQIDDLPTLPAIATRLLSLTASDESDAREVIRLIGADPSLTAKVLAMCRKAHQGLRQETMTVEKAVVLLGFNAIRNAVLSIKVLEVFEDRARQRPTGGAAGPGEAPPRFDTREFWRHSLGVAVAAETLAAAHPGRRDLPPGEAFVCGLLHDIGKLALYHVLPKSYAKVIELVELNQGSIGEYERRIIGLDHHTAGKRLAEQWNLPARLLDCIWLHGSPLEALPQFEHRRLVGLITLADQIVRRQHIGYSGNFSFREDPRELARQLGLDALQVARCTQELHDQVRQRAESLGLDDEASREGLLASIQRANDMLGRLNVMLDEKSRRAARHGRLLEIISRFHESAPSADSAVLTLGAVVSSAAALLGEGFYAGVLQPGESEPWIVYHFDAAGRVQSSHAVRPPDAWADLAGIDARGASSSGSLLPWLEDAVAAACEPREARMLPLPGPKGTAALLLHDRPAIPPDSELNPITQTWGASLAAAAHQERTQRLGEDLAQANRALTEAQEALLRHESMARLGEMAAGAAHEMNNPLAVICGRAQLLAMALPPSSDESHAARTIVDESHRLSDLITALAEYAEAPEPVKEPTDLATALDDAVRKARHAAHSEVDSRQIRPINLQIQGQLPTMLLDPRQFGVILREILANAMQSSPKTGVTVSARHRAADDMLVVNVTDDGVGMDAHTLEHAFDPFFSAKLAGRRIGMGLPLARQFAMGHAGQIELRSTPGEGTVATLLLPLNAHRR